MTVTSKAAAAERAAHEMRGSAVGSWAQTISTRSLRLFGSVACSFTIELTGSLPARRREILPFGPCRRDTAGGAAGTLPVNAPFELAEFAHDKASGRSRRGFAN